jgi:hypothetical protein
MSIIIQMGLLELWLRIVSAFTQQHSAELLERLKTFISYQKYLIFELELSRILLNLQIDLLQKVPESEIFKVPKLDLLLSIISQLCLLALW